MSGGKVNNVSLALKKGEILGIAGLVGSGRSETARAIFAADQRQKGKFFCQGKNLSFSLPGRQLKWVSE